jgi:hypothetical protein
MVGDYLEEEKDSHCYSGTPTLEDNIIRSK